MPSPRIVLKARPTEAQLADRLRAPRPEGLEIYLDRSDVDPECWLEVLSERMQSVPRTNFPILVEGPVRSLDGSFFDLTRDSAPNRLVVDRLAAFGRSVGALGACVHLIAPIESLSAISREDRLRAIESCVPLTAYYVARCRDAGMIPTVENIPPIARQRESRFMTSTVGAAPEHLARLADRVEGLRFTVDTSHAQLFLSSVGHLDGNPTLRALCRSMAESSAARTMTGFLSPLRGRVATAHVSDADGLLGEGLPYGEGSMDLDAAVDLLLLEAEWVVPEIIEPDPETSERMRAAADRIAARRARIARADS